MDLVREEGFLRGVKHLLVLLFLLLTGALPVLALIKGDLSGGCWWG